MLKIRRFHDHPIFNMEINIPGKDGLYIETGPRFLLKCTQSREAQMAKASQRLWLHSTGPLRYHLPPDISHRLRHDLSIRSIHSAHVTSCNVIYHNAMSFCCNPLYIMLFISYLHWVLMLVLYFVIYGSSLSSLSYAILFVPTDFLVNVNHICVNCCLCENDKCNDTSSMGQWVKIWIDFSINCGVVTIKWSTKITFSIVEQHNALPGIGTSRRPSLVNYSNSIYFVEYLTCVMSFYAISSRVKIRMKYDIRRKLDNLYNPAIVIFMSLSAVHHAYLFTGICPKSC